MHLKFCIVGCLTFSSGSVADITKHETAKKNNQFSKNQKIAHLYPFLFCSRSALFSSPNKFQGENVNCFEIKRSGDDRIKRKKDIFFFYSPTYAILD